MRDTDGELKTDRQDIADVFADFYADLYASRELSAVERTPTEVNHEFNAISPEEINDQLKLMANGKGADSKGVVVELLKHSSDKFIQLVADVFTDLLKPDAQIPSQWKSTCLKVLFKKGDAKMPENYRPIAVIPILYKLFSKVICARVNGILMASQSVDQAGFRSGFSCEDHLFVLTLLAEMFHEFQRPLWIVMVDFRKAFDTLNHSSLWLALLEQEVPTVYVCMLQRLYEGQSAQVQTDRLSKELLIERGVRQGDPISPILFNAATEKLIKGLKVRWQRKRYGIQMNGAWLSNLRFADDLALIATSKGQAKSMLRDLITGAASYGLEVHPNKTKLLWNGHGSQPNMRPTKIAGMSFEILHKDESSMYLGRLFNFGDTHDVELKHRVDRAWAKFAVYREELTSRSYSLPQRLKLFTATVQPTMLYGCSCWTLTHARSQKIQSTQRRMLRSVLGVRRRPLLDECGAKSVESWIDWVQRATREVENTMLEFKVPEWVEETWRRKFRWAGHVARRFDGRWTKEILRYIPIGKRAQGRPRIRWSDSLDAFFTYRQHEDTAYATWGGIAQSRETWHDLEDDFVQFVRQR